MSSLESTDDRPGWSRRRNRGWVYPDVVAAEAAGWKALEFYVRRYPHSTEAQWRRRLEEGRIRGPGGPLGPEERLRSGQRLSTTGRPGPSRPHPDAST